MGGNGNFWIAAAAAVVVLAGGIMLWFWIPFSPVKRRFRKDISALLEESRGTAGNEIFTQEDFSHLPAAICRYLEHCGYIGTPKMSFLKMCYHDVAFWQERNGSALRIDYLQYNFVKNPCRMALIDSRLFGIPFEGYDYYQNGRGGMKGVIAKAITLFDQKGPKMDQACLATFLAESLFAPSILLQDYISFEETGDYEVRAVIRYGGQTAGGIFTFNEAYEMISFTTNDRAVTKKDGSMEYIPWSAVCGEYRLSENGIRYPSKFRAVWNGSDGDFVYFDGRISEISCG
ncbi:MAG TPA: hypothetical protein H9700_06055 [Candidatus Eisenbergiella intestinipullorum]|nr:hypothetical protein [Candidatus Eisenbergiella intestinipullorum]